MLVPDEQSCEGTPMCENGITVSTYSVYHTSFHTPEQRSRWDKEVPSAHRGSNFYNSLVAVCSVETRTRRDILLSSVSVRNMARSIFGIKPVSNDTVCV